MRRLSTNGRSSIIFSDSTKCILLQLQNGSSTSSSSSSSTSSSTSPPSSSGQSSHLEGDKNYQKDETVRKLNEFNGQEWKIYCLISISVLLCYGNGLFGAFVHDDIPAIVVNNDVIGVNPPRKLLQNDFWGTPMSSLTSHKSYRPLTTLTFRLNRIFFGMQPIWFHAVNIFLHLTATILFTRFSFSVLNIRKGFATIAGLLFAVHPIHTEAVTGIVGRADVLASVFFILSLYFHLKTKSPKIVLTIIFAILSMLAKETGLTVLLVNIIFDIFRRWHLIRRLIYEKHMGTECKILIQRTITLSLVAVVILAMRLGIFNDPFPKFAEQDNPAAFHPNIFTRFRTYTYLFAYNLWMLLCPSDLSHDWQMGSIPLVTSFTDRRNILTLMTFLIVVVAGYKMLQFAQLTLTMGYILLSIPLLPACNIITTVGFVLAERVLYIPSFGFILLIVHGLQLAWDSSHKVRPLLMGMLLLILISYTCKTITRNFDWYSREALLRAGLKVLPQNAKMHYNYGNFLKDTRKLDGAIKHYKEAIRLWPSYASAHNNLGTLMPSIELAEHHFKEAIKFYEGHVNAHCNLGLLYRSANQTVPAEKLLRKCVTLRPKSHLPYLVLAQMETGVTSGGLYKTVSTMVSDSSENKVFFANWLMENNLLIEAQKQFIAGLEITPTDLDAYIGVCKVLRKLGQKSRLLQIISRRHIIENKRNREGFDRRAIYLHSWSIRNEMQNRAMFYDKKIASNTVTSSKKSHSQAHLNMTQNRKEVINPVNIKPILQTTSNLNQTSSFLTDHKDHIIHLFLRTILYKV